MSDFVTALQLVFLDPVLLGIVAAAAVYGIFVGAVPGLTATMAVALMVPMAFDMKPLHALAAVVTLEACAIFAGDIPNALMRMPGTPASAAYTDDMYALARKGRSDYVLGLCLVFSVAGGLFGAAVLIFCAPLLAGVATSFSVSEYFWFYFLGLGCAVVSSRGNALKSLLALLLGLLLATVGPSLAHGTPRFTFGNEDLMQGINFIPAMIGLFGLAEVLRNVGTLNLGGGEGPRAAARPGGFISRFVVGPAASVIGAALPDLWKRKVTTLWASSVGALIGILPGAGADIAAWVSYGISRRFSKRPEEFGKGSVEGICSAGAANNAALGGAWVPTLVLGIPGDSITALVIGIMMMKAVQPGPRIFEKQASLVYGIYIVFILANLLLIPIGLVAIKAGGWILRAPKKILLPVIVLFCIVGAYSVSWDAFDVLVMLVMGLVGFGLERWKVPVGPVVLGLVLGPPFEQKFIQTMTASEYSIGGFFSRPLSATLGVVTLALWFSPLVGRLLRRRPAASAA